MASGAHNLVPAVALDRGARRTIGFVPNAASSLPVFVVVKPLVLYTMAGEPELHRYPFPATQVWSVSLPSEVEPRAYLESLSPADE